MRNLTLAHYVKGILSLDSEEVCASLLRGRTSIEAAYGVNLSIGIITSNFVRSKGAIGSMDTRRSAHWSRRIRLLLAIAVALVPGVAIYLFGSFGFNSFLEATGPSPLSAVNRGPNPTRAPDRDPTEFNPMGVVPPAPVVRGFEFVTVEEAADRIQDDELVLGVFINDEARAYPINMMHGPQREIFNDHVGGRALAATW